MKNLILPTIERRDLTHNGIIRRLEEKTIFSCERCYPSLCKCSNRKQHGIHRSQAGYLDPIVSVYVFFLIVAFPFGCAISILL